jgi:hypothetical protein
VREIRHTEARGSSSQEFPRPEGNLISSLQAEKRIRQSDAEQDRSKARGSNIQEFSQTNRNLFHSPQIPHDVDARKTRQIDAVPAPNSSMAGEGSFQEFPRPDGNLISSLQVTQKLRQTDMAFGFDTARGGSIRPEFPGPHGNFISSMKVSCDAWTRNSGHTEGVNESRTARGSDNMYSPKPSRSLTPSNPASYNASPQSGKREAEHERGTARDGNSQEFLQPDRNVIPGLHVPQDVAAAKTRQTCAAFDCCNAESSNSQEFPRPHGNLISSLRGPQNALARNIGQTEDVNESRTVRSSDNQSSPKPGRSLTPSREAFNTLLSQSGKTETERNSRTARDGNTQESSQPDGNVISSLQVPQNGAARRMQRTDASLNCGKAEGSNSQEFPMPHGNLISSLCVPWSALTRNIGQTEGVNENRTVRSSDNQSSPMPSRSLTPSNWASYNASPHSGKTESEHEREIAIVVNTQECPEPDENVIPSLKVLQDVAARRTGNIDAAHDCSNARCINSQEFPKPHGNLISSLQIQRNAVARNHEWVNQNSISRSVDSSPKLGRSLSQSSGALCNSLSQSEKTETEQNRTARDGNNQEFSQTDGNVISSLEFPQDGAAKRTQKTVAALDCSKARSNDGQEFPKPHGNLISSLQVQRNADARNIGQIDQDYERRTTFNSASPSVSELVENFTGSSRAQCASSPQGTETNASMASCTADRLQEFPQTEGNLYCSLQLKGERRPGQSNPCTENKTRILGEFFSPYKNMNSNVECFTMTQRPGQTVSTDRNILAESSQCQEVLRHDGNTAIAGGTESRYTRSIFAISPPPRLNEQVVESYLIGDDDTSGRTPGQNNSRIESSTTGSGDVQEFPRPAGNLFSSLQVSCDDLARRRWQTEAGFGNSITGNNSGQEFPRTHGNPITNHHITHAAMENSRRQTEACFENSTATGNSVQEFPRPDGNLVSSLQVSRDAGRQTGASIDNQEFTRGNLVSSLQLSGDVGERSGKQSEECFNNSTARRSSVQEFPRPDGNLISSLQPLMERGRPPTEDYKTSTSRGQFFSFTFLKQNLVLYS